MPLPHPRLIVSALKGGAGKTTLALALAAAWRARGLQVAPFKKGPDYIDASWLSLAAGRACHNLDPFLMGWPGVADSFHRRAGPQTVALVEGNRGLFDGLDAAGSTSTAALAKRLRAPVILIVDCTKTTRTVAALLLGCLKFDPQVNLAGVVLNHIAGSRHENLIRHCIEAEVGLPILGVLPRFQKDLPERHMGLVPPQEHPRVQESLAWLERLALSHLDLNGLAAAACGAPELDQPAPPPPRGLLGGEAVRIGLIRDAAFQFYYPENIEALEAAGAEVVFLSALNDQTLPSLDGLYIGGGFPETQAEALADNRAFGRQVKEAAEGGLPVYAECGGLMYLARRLEMKGRIFPMTGVLPLDVVVEARPQGHGYTRVLVDKPNPFYALGTELKGHEFHYSRVTNLHGEEEFLTFKMLRGVGVAGGRDGVVYKNVLATYTHLHAVGAPQWAEGLIGQARAGEGL